MSDTPRKPRRFDVPGEPVRPAEPLPNAAPKPSRTRAPKAIEADSPLQFEPDEAAQRAPVALAVDDLTPPPPPPTPNQGIRWSRILFGALSGLVALAIGLWIDNLVRDLLSRETWLGWIAIGLTVLVAIAALAIALREWLALRRLALIDDLRVRGLAALVSGDQKAALTVVDDLSALYAERDNLAPARAALAAQSGEIIDAEDRLHLAERDLLGPLDRRARALVMGSAKRVSVVTAVSPRALVDVSYVLIENMRLIRQIADLYGGRPGTLGFWRLARNVVGHLAVTGSIAVGDGLVQQLVGHGVAAKLSTRLGEGVVNGLLTARMGISAIDVCRPLAFSDQNRPKIGDFMGELVSLSGNGNTTDDRVEKQPRAKA